MKKGDIYKLKLTDNSKCIQAGIRPVIIVQNDIGNLHSKTTIVCPLTSKRKPRLPTHAFIPAIGGLTRNSTVLCEQLFTINKEDLGLYLGTLKDKNILKRLDNCLKVSLGLEEPITYAKNYNNKEYKCKLNISSQKK